MDIQVDGGVGEGNARELAEAGAGLQVAGSAIYGGDDAEDRCRRLVDILSSAGRNPEWIP